MSHGGGRRGVYRGSGKNTGDVGDEGLKWWDAPAGSHLHSFVLTDPAAGSDDQVEILVRFRDVKTGRVTSKYRYLFSGTDGAGLVYRELRSMVHPGQHAMIKDPQNYAVTGRNRFLGHSRS